MTIYAEFADISNDQFQDAKSIKGYRTRQAFEKVKTFIKDNKGYIATGVLIGAAAGIVPWEDLELNLISNLDLTEEEIELLLQEIEQADQMSGLFDF